MDRNLKRRNFFAQIKESEREEENKNLSRRK